MRRSRPILLLVSAALVASVGAAPAIAAPAAPVSFTILHTNDFHGNLEPSGSNPGAARVATVVNNVRTSVGADNVLLFDGGDMMQGSLLSNIQDGLPTIDYYRTLGFDGATFGNHEFDWGQAVLGDRIAQAEAAATADEQPMQMVAANITKKDAGGACTWDPFNAAVTPYEVYTVGAAPSAVKVGVIGVSSIETPYITIAEATAGLCFRDPAESILHYYDALDAASDVIVVLSHNGFTDGGYGYGFTVYGDQTLAKKLNDAGKPANLIIGGHSHTDVAAAVKVGNTLVAQAHYAGRKVGRFDLTVGMDGSVTANWTRLVVGTGEAKDPVIDALVTGYASDPAYKALINQPVGYSQVDLLRNYNGDNMMGNFVDDAIYGALNGDAVATNDVDMFFNNAGGIRTDWCDKETAPGVWGWTSTAGECQAEGVWTHDPLLLTYGNMFQILPFGNATAVGTMTGAQVLELLNQSATLFKGAIQPAGVRFGFYRYADASGAYAWGAYDAKVYDKATSTWKAIDPAKTYKVGTNEFLAPAGQDGYTPFKYLKSISYWGDMLDAVNAYVSKTYTLANPYKGPDGDGTLDGRIARDGNGNDTYEAGEIVPVTILHHNDSHGNLAKGTYVGYTQLATLIKAERARNATRTILLSGGDNIQGDAMSYYFKSAPLGYAADGTALPTALQVQPLIAAFNAMGYDAMTLGNHEFNFGGQIFKAVLEDATFPILGANVTDTGAYGLATVGVKPYVEKTVGPEGIKVAILGITNHRVPNYELPSNIPGLAFSDPLDKAQELSTALAPTTDAIVALTHIGFTEDPKSVEVDKNVDTNLAKTVSGIDAIVGSHSHTNPASGFGDTKYLPTIVGGPGSVPVIINHAYRYNNTLGELFLGFRPKAGGGYELVAKAGQYKSVVLADAEDATIKAIVDPYVTALAAYNGKEIGKTTVPIDALKAFTEETNGANLQADAAVFELNKHGITPDVHLSGAMTNRKVADAATPASPATLKVSDMFSLMPYENSLVVLRMNGPQIKKVLERAYRNFYYYKYVPGYGGYSYYTTCMIDTNSVGRITYNDLAPAPYDPAKSYVTSLTINGVQVDFANATKFYKVSTVNYLAAGSCNFNDAGVSLWPLNQIVNDTQLYVRDAVIDYVTAKGTVSPAIEGRLQFIADTAGPVISVTVPAARTYLHSDRVRLAFKATDTPAGVLSVTAKVDSRVVTNGQILDLRTIKLGSHTFTTTATDRAGNVSTKTVSFKVTATVKSMIRSVNLYADEHKITSTRLKTRLVSLLNLAEYYRSHQYYMAARAMLGLFSYTVALESRHHITRTAALVLVNDAAYVITNIKK